MEIKRISKYSKIQLILRNMEFMRLCNAENLYNAELKVIQIVADSETIAIEYIPDEYIEDYIAEQSGMSATTNSAPIEPVKSESQKELETALNTVLTNDPRGKYSGCMLKEPFDNGDRDWIEWCLLHMQNKFIRNRIEIIYKSGYGV